MVKIFLNKTVKYNGALYYAHTELEIEDEDLEEMKQHGEVIGQEIVLPVDEPIKNEDETTYEVETPENDTDKKENKPKRTTKKQVEK